MTDDAPYAAVYILGGLGAIAGLPDNIDVGNVLHWPRDQDSYTLVPCHGPAAFLAVENDKGF